MDLNFFLEDNLTKDYEPTSIMYKQLSHTTMNPEAVIFEGNSSPATITPTKTLDPTINSGLTYNLLAQIQIFSVMK